LRKVHGESEPDSKDGLKDAGIVEDGVQADEVGVEEVAEGTTSTVELEVDKSKEDEDAVELEDNGSLTEDDGSLTEDDGSLTEDDGSLTEDDGSLTEDDIKATEFEEDVEVASMLDEVSMTGLDEDATGWSQVTTAPGPPIGINSTSSM
jgi:hypothetical protein